MNLKLKEVLWEITNKCNRNCAYCGSKEIMNKGEDATPEDRLNIAHEIAKNSDRVTLTGGEPLLIRKEFPKLLKIFTANNCAMDIVTNGDKVFALMDTIFENIGISINSINDVKKINWDIIKGFKCNTVIIMNINKINFFDLDEILTIIPLDNLKVQFQLTMYKGYNELMINGNGIENLRDEINFICKQNNIEYVFADNLQAEHECSAGINSCGVQFNGNVVYCLSERSWLTTDRVMGNLHTTSLKSIWQTTFKENRFEDNFKCCRSCFNYTDSKDVDAEPESEEFKPWKGCSAITKLYDDTDSKVMLYGVWQPNVIKPNKTGHNTIYTYGVADITYFSGNSSENSSNIS